MMRVENKEEAMSSAASMVEHAEKLGVLRREEPRAAGALSEGWLKLLTVVAANVRMLLVALWLGAAVFFSFAVAPSAFAVLPSRELAGAMVTRTLAVVNVGGLVVALFALLTTPLAVRAAGRFALWAQSAALVVLALVTAVGHWVIAARLAEMRAGMRGTIDALAQNDPARVAFNALHGYSVAALFVGMLAALAAFFVMARRRG
jgi:hypothetical protein